MKKLLFLLTVVGLTYGQITLNTAVDFTVKDTDGKSHTLFSYLTAGKYVLIDFWATW